MAGAGKTVGQISIKVTPDTDGFRRELKAQLEAISQGLKVEVGADLDTAAAEAKKEALTKKSTLEIDVNLDSAGFQARFAALRAELAKDAKIKVEVDVDKNRFQRAIGGIGDKLGGLLPGGSGGGASRGLGAFGSFADSLALVAAVAAIAAPALALITGALTALPAVLAGVATPIAVIALGLDGIKKAAEVLTEPLKNLKASISDVFKTRLTPVFTTLAQAMPKLEGPLKAVANGISDVAQSFVDTITSGPGLAKIQDTIKNIADAISTAAPGIGRLTDGLLGLADRVSSKFPAVAKWFDQAADSFAKWVDKATADGSLDRAMGNLGDTLKGVLDIVGDIAKQGFDWLQDPAFAKSMTDFVQNTKTLVNDIMPGLGGIFTQISSALNGIVPILDRIDKWKPPSWLGLNGDKSKQDSGFGGFPNMENPNKGKPPGVLDDLESGAWIDQTKNSFKLFWSEAIAQALGAMAQIQAIVTTSFGGMVSSAGQLLGSIWMNVVSSASAAWNSVVGIVSGAIANIGSFFGQIPSRLAAAWSSLGGVAAGAWNAVVAAVANAFAQAVAAVAQGAAQIVAEAAAIPGKVAAAIGSLAGTLVAAGKSLMDGLLSGIKAGLSAVLSFAAGIAAKIAAVKGPLPKDRTTLTPAGQALMQGLQDGIEGGLQGVLDRASQIGQQIADAINGGTSGVSLGQLPDQLNKSLDELELERKDLKVQKDALPKTDKDGRKALQGQMDQIQALKDQLALQKEQLGFSDKYGESQKNNGATVGDELNKLVDGFKAFGSGNVKQLMSDLGISGDGAIPQLLDQGLNFLSQSLTGLLTGGGGGGSTVINVGSVDDAVAAKNTLTNKKSLQFKQR